MDSNTFQFPIQQGTFLAAGGMDIAVPCRRDQQPASCACRESYMERYQSEQPRVLGLVAVGLDNVDGHQRITQTQDFLVVGGSEETHERMQETAMLFEEALERTGRTLADTDLEEVISLLCEIRDAMSET